MGFTSLPDRAPDELRAPGGPGSILVLPFPEGTHLVVVIAGEADLATAGQLLEQLVDALRWRPITMVLDVSDLEFCDLAGLDALHEAAQAAGAVGIAVTFRGMRARLRWLHQHFPAAAPHATRRTPVAGARSPSVEIPGEEVRTGANR